MARKTVEEKATKKAARDGNLKRGFYGGEVKDRWQAAFEYRVATLAKQILISCSEAMAQLRDDSGRCPFGDWDIRKNQWRLQRMFTQLEAGSFKDPTKGEIYVMLYEIFYGSKSVVTKDGDVVEVDLEPNEKVRIIAEINRMGGHYAPEKSEHKFDLSRTEHIIMELYKMEKGEKVKELNDSENRIKKHLKR